MSLGDNKQRLTDQARKIIILFSCNKTKQEPKTKKKIVWATKLYRKNIFENVCGWETIIWGHTKDWESKTCQEQL